MSEQAQTPETGTPATPTDAGALLFEMPKVPGGPHEMAKRLAEHRKAKQEATAQPAEVTEAPDADPTEAEAAQATPKPDVADEPEEAVEAAETDEDAEIEAAEGEEPEAAIEEPEDVAGEDEDDAEALIGPFKIDGREVSLTADEVHDLVSKSSVAESRLQEAGEERRKAITLLEQADARRGEIEQRLSRLDDLIASSDIPEPDWNKVLEEQGGEALQRLQLQWQAHLNKRSELTAARKAEADKAETERLEQANAWVKEETERFQEDLRSALHSPKIRGAALDQAMQGEIKRMAEYAVSSGWEAERVSEIVDHRTLGWLRKAMLYDALQAEKPKVTKKVREAPPSVTPKVAPESKKSKKAKQRAALVQSLQQSIGKGTRERSIAMSNLRKFDRENAA